MSRCISNAVRLERVRNRERGTVLPADDRRLTTDDRDSEPVSAADHDPESVAAKSSTGITE